MARVHNLDNMPTPSPYTHPAENTTAAEAAATEARGISPVVEELQEGAVASPTREQVAESARALQEALARSRPEDWHVGFREDADTGIFVIEIKDDEGRVIKQFPSEKILNLHLKLDDLAGVVVDETT